MADLARGLAADSGMASGYGGGYSSGGYGGGVMSPYGGSPGGLGGRRDPGYQDQEQKEQSEKSWKNQLKLVLHLTGRMA